MTTSNRLMQAVNISQKSLPSSGPDFVGQSPQTISNSSSGLSVVTDSSNTDIFHVYVIGISGGSSTIAHYSFDSSTETISDLAYQGISPSSFVSIVDLVVKGDGLKGIALRDNGDVYGFDFGTAYDISTITNVTLHNTAMDNGLDYYHIEQSPDDNVWYIGVADFTDSVQRWNVSTSGWDFSGTWTKEAEWYESANGSTSLGLASEALRGRNIGAGNDGAGIGASRFGLLNEYFDTLSGSGDSLSGGDGGRNLLSLRSFLGWFGSAAMIKGATWFSGGELFVHCLTAEGQTPTYRSKIVQFTLPSTTAGSLLDKGLTVSKYDLTAQTTVSPYTSMHVSQDGRYLMLLEDDLTSYRTNVFEFGTKGDITTLTLYDQYFGPSKSSGYYSWSFFCDPTGKKIFSPSNFNDGKVYLVEYTGGNDWEPSSSTGSSQSVFTDTTNLDYPTDIAFSRDGLKMFIMSSSFSITTSVTGGERTTLHEYSVSSPFSFTGATHVGSVEIWLGGGTFLFNFSNNGRVLYVSSEEGNCVIEIPLDAPYRLPTDNIMSTDFTRKIFSCYEDIGNLDYYNIPKAYEGVYGNNILLWNPISEEVIAVQKV